MKGSQVTEADYEYISRLFAQEEQELLQEMKARADEKDLPEIMISAEQARFLHLLIRVHQPEYCLDIGTLFGFSAAIMTRAMGDSGKVVTIEKKEKHMDVARQNFERLGVDDRIECVQGNAVEAVEDLAGSRTFDLVMIDADKQNYSTYFKKSLDLVRKGALILADNTLYKGKAAAGELSPEDSDDQNAQAIRAYNELTAGHPDVETVIVPTGDGFSISRYEVSN